MFVNTLTCIQYSLDVIKEEVRQLLRLGVVSRKQKIYSLYQYIPPREWLGIERELEKYEFLPRDRISDLLGREEWDND